MNALGEDGKTNGEKQLLCVFLRIPASSSSVVPCLLCSAFRQNGFHDLFGWKNSSLLPEGATVLGV